MKRSLRQRMSNEQNKWIDEMLHDVESLLPHTQFLFDKINFQLEASMGVTNLEQNKVIKIFSVAAVIFLPPTLIASIYGMNFTACRSSPGSTAIHSLVLMVMSSLGTGLFFKRKAGCDAGDPAPKEIVDWGHGPRLPRPRPPCKGPPSPHIPFILCTDDPGQP